MKVFGFTGEARHGKDTAANMLAEYLREQGETVRVSAWANKLKVSAARALGYTTLSEEECVEFCDTMKEGGSLIAVGPNGVQQGPVLAFRKFLEFLGTEGGRDVHGWNVWVDLALPAPVRVRTPGGHTNVLRAGEGEPSEFAGRLAGFEGVDTYIDATTRFDNEVDRIREWDGWIIRIERPSVDNGLEPDAHQSRRGIPRERADVTIINDGTLDDLRDMVVEAYKALTVRHLTGPMLLRREAGELLA